MFLKKLELQGFKTFASRTEFVFQSGITAIVGPNGSGKSNIADAVRWVLGEQSPRPLRIKRSDDVIFAGSATRPRVGMAEVTITLDNTTRWLPLDFSEVTITRRAYRSGESEYLINKNRVRLRDVVDMLLQANIGQNTYTVIGQGAVDAALALRPEERRTLFEEAADIKRYQIKRNESLAKLEASEANLVRVRDLMAEIAPRLQTLQEQAQRVREHEQLLAELRGYLAAWYAHRWQQAGDELRRAIATETAVETALTTAEAALQDVSDRLAALRQREGELRQQLSDWHRQSSDLHAQAEALERRLAVGRAQAEGALRQRQELLDELAPLQEQLAAQNRAVAAVEEELAELAKRQEERQAALSALEQKAADLEAARRNDESALEAAENAAVEATAVIAATESTLAALSSRRQSLQDDIASRRQRMGEHQTAMERCAQTMGELQAHIAELDRQIGDLAAQRREAQVTIADLRQRYEAAQDAVRAAHDQRRALELRHETLTRLHESMTGYDAGVRSVLNAARMNTLSGIVGTVAEILRVPAQYEAAISAALGSHEQDIVVESWQQAEAAVEHLRRSRAGRATFLPLDTIRPRQNPASVRDAIGWACDVVEVADRYRSIAVYLLGRVLLVQDLGIARRLLNRPGLPPVSSIVTLAGDIVRPGGAITGGSPVARSSAILERERELTELPSRLQAAATEEQAADRRLAQAQAALRQAEERLVTLDGESAALRHQRDEAAGLLAQAQRERDRWQREMAWETEQERQAQQALVSLESQAEELTAELTARRQRQADAQAMIASLRQRLASVAGSELARQVSEARTMVALGQQEIAARQALLAAKQQEADRLAAYIAARQRRADELAQQAEAMAADVAAAQDQAQELSRAIAALRSMIAPAEAAVEDLAQQRVKLLEEEMAARNRLTALERSRSQAAITTQKARSELSKLQAQIEAEETLSVPGYNLGEEEMGRLLEQWAVPVQLSLGVLTAEGQEQQVPVATPEVIRRHVDSLRAQVRRLGPINPNAVTEYEETLKRYTFLSSQSDDLDKAVASLKQVIGELDQFMRERFETTFEAVNREFRRHFVALFGGGTARLSLTDPDDLAQTGVEIVAQPPGKRLQSLALLSGGERALTAVALLFAILTVNPTPFCVLDEVDAALDDANVGRFCDALKALAERTQFIVITHNKGTMEIASALYGVSMTTDGSSQVISVKLEDIPNDSTPDA